MDTLINDIYKFRNEAEYKLAKKEISQNAATFNDENKTIENLFTHHDFYNKSTYVEVKKKILKYDVYSI